MILASRSEVFHKLLSSNMQDAKEGIITLSDIHTSTFQEILRYLYCEEVQILETEIQ